MGKGLRLTGDRSQLEAGVYALAAILLGGLLLFTLAGYNSELAPAGDEDCVLTTPSQLERALEDAEKPLAVMFTSDTCPVCQQMEPHWSQLCGRDDLPVRFVMFKLNKATVDVFLSYSVTETPTFIVFKDGDPVARHVGGFTGQNITGVMLEWALSAAGTAGEGSLDLLQKSCVQCHTVPEELDPETIREWIEANPDDDLARTVGAAANAGVTVSELYGGSQSLAMFIQSMNESLTPDEAYRIALLLDAMAASLHKGESSTIQEEAGLDLGLAAGTGAALLAGLIAAFSPCVFPLLLAYLTTLASRGEAPSLGGGAALKAFLAAAAGTLVIGSFFLVLGDLASGVAEVLLPAAALLLVGAGVLGYLEVPTFINMSVKSRRGITGFSFIYGLLAVQCSLPLVASALMIIASGGLETGVPSLLAFSLGIAAPVGLAVYATQKGRLGTLLERLSSREARRITHLVLAFMGAILLFYSLGMI